MGETRVRTCSSRLTAALNCSVSFQQSNGLSLFFLLDKASDKTAGSVIESTEVRREGGGGRRTDSKQALTPSRAFPTSPFSTSLTFFCTRSTLDRTSSRSPLRIALVVPAAEAEASLEVLEAASSEAREEARAASCSRREERDRAS